MPHIRFRKLSPSIAMVLAVFFGAAKVRATTLMVLADWYDIRSTDTLFRADSLWVPQFDTATRNGYYFGKGNLKLARTDAFAMPIPVNTSASVSIPIPRSLERRWYALPDYSSSNFYSQRILFKFNHVEGMHFALQKADGALDIQLDTASRIGQTTELNQATISAPGLLDRCLDSLPVTDTLWIRNHAAVDRFVSAVDCYNHNPFWIERGAIWFNPGFPVVEAFVEVDGERVPMRPNSSFPGWYSAPRLDSSSVRRPSSRLRFSGKSQNGNALAWDSLGAAWTVAIDSADSVWMRPEGLSANQRPDPRKPEVWIGFPSDARLALGPSVPGFVGKPKAMGWAGFPLWNRPDSVWLVHVDGSRSSAIRIPAVGDSIWLVGDSLGRAPVAPSIDTVWIKARAFDYDKTYNPFAEKGPDDNCVKSAGGATRGLVQASLDSAGLPVWTGKVACDIGSLADGPGNWFKPGRALLDTTVSIRLVRSATTGQWSYANQLFFPLDQASTAPLAEHNYGFCLHFEFETSNDFDRTMSITGDDDIWLFAQRKLALDLGGQHGPISGRIAFNTLGMPDGSPVRLDLFQCERHATGSTLAISTNGLLLPIGTIKEPPPTASVSIEANRRNLTSIDGRRLRIDPSDNGSWTLRIRTLDGRKLREHAGRGVQIVDLGPRGIPMIVDLIAAGVRETMTIFVR